MKLYKKDSKGKIRVLEIRTEGNILVQESGLIEGALVKHVRPCKGKNIGKSNETTPEQQAISEMNSKIEAKLTEGYFYSMDEWTEVTLPMLACSYEDEKDKIDWTNCFVQPKLDGMRCLAFIKKGKVTLMSRKGKEITTVPHIIKDLESIKEDIILDGELYSHGDSFQENMRLIKKFRSGETDIKVKYHIYDMVSDKPFSKRLIKPYLKNKSACIEVTTYPCESEKLLKEWHTFNIKDGYEGSMIRYGNSPYKVNGRSNSLLKYKDFLDIAIQIKDIRPNEANPLHGTPVFHWLGAKNDELEAGLRMSHKDREDFLKNKSNYIGKTAEVRFFEYSEEGVPRFPVMVGFRLDK